MNPQPTCAATCSTWAAMTARDWHISNKLFICRLCLKIYCPKTKEDTKCTS